MSSQYRHADAVILAGGRATRMAGQNKALIQYQGQALYRYALANIVTHADQVIISTQRDKQYFVEQGFAVVDDGEFTDHGPLAGIAAALEYSQAPILLIASCDQLVLPTDIYPTLIETVTEERGAVASNGKDLIPTCAVLPATVRGNLHQRLKHNRLRLTEFMRECCDVCEFPPFKFENINRLDQLK